MARKPCGLTHVTAIPLGRRLRAASGNLPGRLIRTRPGRNALPRRPYSVLLPVGFAVPFPLPGPRCALTAPFHPCRVSSKGARRSVLCGTFPGVAPAGRYPAPYVQGARTFLRGRLSTLAATAARPTDTPLGMGTEAAGVKSYRGSVRAPSASRVLDSPPIRARTLAQYAAACGVIATARWPA